MCVVLQIQGQQIISFNLKIIQRIRQNYIFIWNPKQVQIAIECKGGQQIQNRHRPDTSLKGSNDIVLLYS